VERARIPAIMLSESALTLIRDVFANPALFRQAHRIRRRQVAWQPNDAPQVFEHLAVVVSEEQLLAELPKPALSGQGADWSLIAAGRPQHRFGSRIATATQVHPGADSAACSIESRPVGWRFLIANSPDTAWLLSVGGDTGFPASPAIAEPLTTETSFAIGSAAMTFDPICGDGTAHAIREAILAVACIRAISNGEPAAHIRAHFEARLVLGFRRHLALALGFYQSGHGGAWWDAEIEATLDGIGWCDERIAAFGPPRYRLVDQTLSRTMN
jgi:hypothetical protein